MSLYLYEWYQSEETSLINRIVVLIISIFILDAAAFFVLGIANTNNSQTLLSAYMLIWLVGIGKLREKANEFIIMSPFWFYFLLTSLILTFFNESLLFFIFSLDTALYPSGDLSAEAAYLKQLVLFAPVYLALALCILMLHRFFKLKPSDMFVFGSLGSLAGIFFTGVIQWETMWLFAGLYMGIYGVIFSFTKPFSLERGSSKKIYGLGLPLLLILVFAGSTLGHEFISLLFDEVTNS